MEEIKELKSPTGRSELVAANYNKLSDHIRRLTPQGIQCSVFCGGVNCKYENPENWTADNLAIQGIYSHWITDNILAMARPSTVIIIKKNIIQQFESLGIKSIINLQSPKEHASCGQPLESSGFSYDPSIFMENNIYYYNFAWKDYGDATLLGLLNMVKVLTFAISEGRVAVHCHAGLGRTGVLIACYLVYSLRVEANDAIRFVRYKRPGSVQTRGQIICVRHFANSILPQSIIFYIRENDKEKYMAPFTLSRYLRRQKVMLHGYDERIFKFLPKIIHVICERILKICGCWVDEFGSTSNLPLTTDFLCEKNGNKVQRHESLYSICSSFFESSLLSPDINSPTSKNADILNSPSAPPSPNLSESSDTFSELDGDEVNENQLLENKCFQELETQKSFQEENHEETVEIQDVRVVADALLVDVTMLDPEIKQAIRIIQIELNNSQIGWSKLTLETDVLVLVGLLYDWLETLKKSILNMEDMENIVINYKQTELCFLKIDTKSTYLIEYLLYFITKIQPITKEKQIDILRRFLAAFTHRTVVINDNSIPAGRNFGKLREGTLSCAMEFLESLLVMVEAHHHRRKSRTEYFDTFRDISDIESDAESNCFH